MTDQLEQALVYRQPVRHDFSAYARNPGYRDWMIQPGKNSQGANKHKNAWTHVQARQTTAPTQRDLWCRCGFCFVRSSRFSANKPVGDRLPGVA
jgi:hypothetical protein